MTNPAKEFQAALERQAGVKVAKITLDPGWPRTSPTCHLMPWLAFRLPLTR